MCKKVLLSIIFAGNLGLSVGWVFANVEYVFTGPDGAQITEDQHRLVFNAVNNFQFPMCLCNKDLASNHDLVDARGQYDELGLLRKALLPGGIAVYAIPQMIYTIIFIQFVDGKYKAIQKTGDLRCDGWTLFKEKVTKVYYESSDAMMFNRCDVLRDLHFELNHLCTERLQGILSGIKESSLDSFSLPVWRWCDGPAAASVCKAVFKHELLSLLNVGKFSIFRGTQGVDGKLDSSIKDDHSYSLSFGMCILGGIINDASACVLRYIVEPKSCCYCIDLDKLAFISKQCEYHLFYIPPISSIASVFLSGETFHPRLKLAVLSGLGYRDAGFHDEIMWGFDDSLWINYLATLPGFRPLSDLGPKFELSEFERKLQLSEFERQFQEYLRDATILKEKDSGKGDLPSFDRKDDSVSQSNGSNMWTNAPIIATAAGVVVCGSVLGVAYASKLSKKRKKNCKQVEQGDTECTTYANSLSVRRKPVS